MFSFAFFVFIVAENDKEKQTQYGVYFYLLQPTSFFMAS